MDFNFPLENSLLLSHTVLSGKQVLNNPFILSDNMMHSDHLLTVVFDWIWFCAHFLCRLWLVVICDCSVKKSCVDCIFIPRDPIMGVFDFIRLVIAELGFSIFTYQLPGKISLALRNKPLCIYTHQLATSYFHWSQFPNKMNHLE